MTAVDDAVARHLLPECSTCSEVIAAGWHREREENCVSAAVGAGSLWDEAQYDEVVRRALDRAKQYQAVADKERRDAARVLPRLLRQPFERQLILVRNSRHYQTGAVCDLLLETSFSRITEDPRVSEQLAQVALAAARLLDGDRYPGELVHDFQGRSWAYLANARRVLGDLAGADLALDAARSLLDLGTGNPLDEAWCWDVETSLHSSRADYRQALLCGCRAIALYGQVGERHLVGRTLIKQGMVWGYAEDLVREVVFVRTGLELIEPERDPRVALAGWHNLCWALHQAGQHRQALTALTRARPAYLSLGGRGNLLRFQWLEGTIAAALRRDEQAEGCLREAREGFIQLGVDYDAAAVSIDLAALLCRQGRTAEVRSLTAEMIAVFESRGSRRATLAAFVLLGQAAERDRLTEALIRRIGVSLDRARSND